MKKVIFILIIHLWSNIMLSQTFCNESEKLIIKDSIAYFEINSNGCVIIEFKGKGTYEKVDEKYFVIRTSKYEDKKSRLTKSKSNVKPGIVRFKTSDAKGKPISAANISILDQDENIIDGTTTDLNGIAEIDFHESLKIAKIQLLGYHEFEFEIDRFEDYKIQLAEGEYIEDKQVILKYENYQNGEFDYYLMDIIPNEEKINWRKIRRMCSTGTECNNIRKRKMKKCHNYNVYDVQYQQKLATPHTHYHYEQTKTKY